MLKNPKSGTTFTILQQAETPSTANVTVSATLSTSAGNITVPDVSLYGRQSKILVTDYSFGSHKLLYSTADVLTNGVFDTDVLVLYLKAGQIGELAFQGEDGDLGYDVSGCSKVSVTTNGTLQVIKWTQSPGRTAVKLSNGVLLYLLDQSKAWRFWAPTTTSYPYAKANQHLFVLGPYLVRSAQISGKSLHVSGDNDKTTTLEAYVGSASIEAIIWNGLSRPATKTPYGSYRATIPGAENRTISLPVLKEWQSADSLPETDPKYDDSNWVACNKTTTKNPYTPATLPVLYSSDYDYHVGAKVYRGYFDGDSSTAVDITASGGLGFGWDAWLNGVHIGGNVGDGSHTTTSESLALPRDALLPKDNVLTVLVDYHGHDQASTAKGLMNPRGILSAALSPNKTGTGFKQWKLQGNAGGGAGNIDPVRGPMNEGGLYGERMGWFLPGFDPSSSSSPSTKFDTSTPLDGISAPGVRFYTTSFTLDIDDDLDMPLGISFSAPAGTQARVMFWINGYQYGKFVPHLGPQTRFPIPPGIVNNRGNNTLAVSLWAQGAKGAKLDNVELFAYGAYQTDFGFNRDWSALQPGWSDRSEYA